MPTKIAINGFGRIGRTAFKQALENKELEVVAINDLTTEDNLAYLLRFDSIHGPYEKEVKAVEEDGKHYLEVDGKKYLLLTEKDPTQLPWGDLDVDVVIESTGVFTTTEKASAHLEAGAKRVVISAPAKDEETPNKLVGSNAEDFNEKLAKITSNASCTTNAVVPLTAIFLKELGFSKSMMTTVHGYTASQSIVDGPNPKDHLRGRAAAVNIVPSHTGAAVASAKSNPSLKGKFDAVAMRVPVIAGSIVDFVFLADKKTTVEEVNDILRNAAKNDHWKGIFTVTEEPLVSTDILGNPHASIADLSFTRVVDGDLVKVLAWYDNEWGYTSALMKHVVEVGKLV
ncbi:MAG: type I glyceraldehyde-3-phosphate dehydrogenase [Candidatus Spechtbacterales bacterium]|nr:type I glyceraldehyde-3-phosphate dehydrogenase [Candidatus Spechtbacterales bacterium]